MFRAERLILLLHKNKRTDGLLEKNKSPFFAERDKRTNKNISTNEIKVKGLGQAFFPKGLRVSRGQSHLVAVRRQRNPFACG